MLVFSCGTNRTPDQIYTQNIPNSSKLIYSCRYYGEFVTSSDHYKIVIQDSTKKIFDDGFVEITGKGTIESINPNNTIKFIHTEYNDQFIGENDSISTTIENSSNFKFITTRYQSSYGMNEEYYFDKFIETSDSLSFIGLKSKYSEKRVNALSFKKGGIWIKDKDGTVSEITLSRIMSRNRSEGNPIQYGRKHYSFRPIKKTHPNELTNYGIFKRIK